MNWIIIWRVISELQCWFFPHWISTWVSLSCWIWILPKAFKFFLMYVYCIPVTVMIIIVMIFWPILVRCVWNFCHEFIDQFTLNCQFYYILLFRLLSFRPKDPWFMKFNMVSNPMLRPTTNPTNFHDCTRSYWVST